MKNFLSKTVLGTLACASIFALATSAFAQVQVSNKDDNKKPDEIKFINKEDIFIAHDSKGTEIKCGKVEGVYVPVKKAIGVKNGYKLYTSDIKDLRKKLAKATSKKKIAKLKAKIKLLVEKNVIASSICGLGEGGSDPLSFDFTNAVGLYHSVSLEGLNNISSISDLTDIIALRNIDKDGNLTSTKKTGVSQIFSYEIPATSEGDKVFISLLFKKNPQKPTQICKINDEGCCTLLKVDKATGQVEECIDNKITLIKDFRISSALGTVLNKVMGDLGFENDENVTSSPNVQFDSAGNIYYAGYYTNGRQVIARYNPKTKEVKHVMFGAGDSISSFIASKYDGNVFVAYKKKGNATGGLYVVNMENGTKKQIMVDQPNFIVPSGDGRLFVGVSQEAVKDTGGTRVTYLTRGVRALNMSTLEFDDHMYTGIGRGLDKPAEYPVAQICSQEDAPADFCKNYANEFTKITMKGKSPANGIYGLSSPKVGDLMQLYPELKFYKSSVVVKKDILALPDGNLIVTGYNSEGNNITTLVNTATDTEHVLLDENNQYDLNQIDYVPSTNTIVFYGTNIAKNKIVHGMYSLTEHRITAEKAHIADIGFRLQTFK